MENQHNVRVKEYEKVDKEASEILKQLAKIDREDVQMQENRKHLKNKEKKTNKALAAVRIYLMSLCSPPISPTFASGSLIGFFPTFLYCL